MHLTKLICRLAAIACLAGLVLSGPVLAQSYPARPVKLIVPYPPGGPADVMGRIFAERLSAMWGGHPVVVDNRAGAGGNIGSEVTARSAPDGYTILLIASSHVTNGGLYDNLPYDVIKDFTPVVFLATMTNVAMVNPATPVKSIQEFIDYAKANPGKLNFASPGNGSSAHLTGEMFKQVTGVAMQHVPYKGSAPALMDLIAGRIDIMFDNIPLPLPHIRAGKLRGLAVTAAQRSPSLPELPTLAEAGVSGFDVSSWYGIYAPAGLSQETVAKLNAAFNEALRAPEIRERLTTQGWTVTGGTPEQFAAHTQAELERWARVVKSANVRID